MAGMNASGLLKNDPYSQGLYKQITEAPYITPDRQNYLLYQAGIVGKDWKPGGTTPLPPQGGAGAPYNPGQVFNPATGAFGSAPKPPSSVPTFAPPDTKLNPSSSIASQSDPKIQALLQQLTQQAAMSPNSTTGPQIDDLKRQIMEAQSAQGATANQLDELGKPINVARPDSSRTDAQAAQLQALLQQLMRGEGISVGPANQDPQAQAFRVAKLREAERARESEAARLGASGQTGSGDFDSRLAQINEAAGSDIASFEADLTGRKRTEATQNALSGAQLGLSELDRQRQGEQAKFENEVNLEQARRGGLLSAAQTSAATGASRLSSLQSLLQALMGQESASQQMSTQSREALLQQLLGEQGRVQSTATSNSLAQQQAAIQAEQLRMEQERFRQQSQDRLRNMPKGNFRGGMVVR